MAVGKMHKETCLVLSCLLVMAVAQSKYKYEGVDVKELLENKRLLMAYTDCFIGRGKCTPEGNMMKGDIQEALETGCEMCTNEQLENVSNLIKHLMKHDEESWKGLINKYDPEGVWRKTYEERAKTLGVTF